jgi:hypothetical protein
MADTKIYDIGDVAVVRFKFTPEPPSAYTVSVRDPLGVITEVDGIADPDTIAWPDYFRADVPLTMHGTWYVRVVGTAGAIGAEEQSIDVQPSRFINP